MKYEVHQEAEIICFVFCPGGGGFQCVHLSLPFFDISGDELVVTESKDSVVTQEFVG